MYQRVLLAISIVFGFLFLGLASARSALAAECTDTWVGPAEGSWQTAANWSTGHAPTETDVACIASGKTAKVEATQKVAVVQGEGAVVISGLLTLAGAPSEAVSIIGALTLSGGSLTGVGSLEVTASLSGHGSMSGSGSTTLLGGATGALSSVSLAERTLANKGSLTLGTSYLNMSHSARLINSGTFTINTEGLETGVIHPWSESNPLIINTGTIQKTSGSGESAIAVKLENFGLVKAGVGTLNTYGESEFFGAESVVEGSVSLTGSTVTAQSFTSPSGTVTVGGSTSLAIEKGYTATVANLTLKGYVRGAGSLQVAGSLSWHSGSMSGTGSTVLLPGATGAVENVSIYERTLVNEGALTFASGYLIMETGAKIENKSIFTINAEGRESFIHRVNYQTAEPLIVNSGTLQKTSGTGASGFNINFEDSGPIKAASGNLEIGGPSAKLANGVTLEGSIYLLSNNVTTHSFTASKGIIRTGGSTFFTIEGGGTARVEKFTLVGGGWLRGAGTLEVTNTLNVDGKLEESGSTILRPGGTGTIEEASIRSGYTFVNEGVTTLASRYLAMSTGARVVNTGTFNANVEGKELGILLTGSGTAPLFVNAGTFQKTEGPGTTEVQPSFENFGVVHEPSGKLKFLRPIAASGTTATPHHACSGDPVDCATGNFTETQTDFEIGGRGVGLDLVRTYSTQTAAASSLGIFGYGWTNSFGDKLTSEESGGKQTLTDASGGTVTFIKSGASYLAPSWSRDSLTGSTEAGFTLTLPNQTKEKFSGSGRLESVTDRNGNETTLAYNGSGKLETITDPTGRKITLTYNAEGLVEKAKDPMGHEVKYAYAYEGKALKSVTLPGEASPNWQFKYDASHRMIQLTDGRGGKTTNEYDSSSRVISQTDPAERRTTWEYAPFHTKITNKATGAVTDEWFNSFNQPMSITRGFGTAAATTEAFTYTAAGLLASRTDGDGHIWSYGYDESGNRTSEVDPLKDETKWTFSEANQLLTETKPSGEKTTITRNANGNPETVSRPAPESKTQTVSYEYGPHGEVKAMTNPLGNTWSYEYDSHGDLKAEIDPEGDKRSWGYDEDSRVISAVSPRGNEEGAEAAKFTISIERDAQGRPLKITDPLEGATKYVYDADGNVESITDQNGRKTKFTYDADNERTKVERPNGAVEETGYDGAGQVTSQTDGNKQKTTYVRNVLEVPVEVIDPLERKTTETFDAAGNLKTKVDPDGRTTTFTYDNANRLKEISYSDGITPKASFGYDKGGNLTSMSDGSGESSYEYDQLDRLIHSKDGNGDTASWKYNLGNEPVGLTYPNGKSISRLYDKAGRLESLTDWLGHTSSFAYNKDSELSKTTFPSGTGNVDEYAFDRADRMSAVTMKKGAETLASLSYARDKVGQVESLISKGLPGAEEESFAYDENERLKSAGAGSYEYDNANNPTEAPGTTNAFDKASQLESATGATFSYDKEGERTKRTPSSGPATTYKYDQAGNLTAVERAEEGETPAIAEYFGYNGTDLLASRTVGLSTQHLTWDTSEALPLLLSDGENSYLYGPSGLAVEQISSGEVPTYLHHDQLGSTRLLTNSSGEVAGTATFSPYGAVSGKTGAGTSPLGFAGQYTMGQSGLIYLRARFYDPGTAQFVSVDPLEAKTRQPYAYALNNPQNVFDPSGLCGVDSVESILESFNPTSEEICIFQGASAAIPDSAGQPIASAAAGFGDTLSLGLTNLAREELGVNGPVNKCSGFYLGGQTAAYILGVTFAVNPDVLGPASYYADRFGENFPRTATWLEENAERIYEVSGPAETYIRWIFHQVF